MASDSSTAWVEAAPFRAHVRLLMAETDVPGSVVAALARVQPRVVDRLLTGAGRRPLRRLSPVVACRLYCVTAGLVRQSQIAEVPAAPVGAALRRLREAGWSLGELAGMLRVDVSTVIDLVDDRAEVCALLLALRTRAIPVPRGGLGSAMPMADAA